MITPYSPADSIKVALRNADRTELADQLFFDWPSLYLIALRFAREVSPFIEFAPGVSLLQHGLKKAIDEYHSVVGCSQQLAQREYCLALIEAINMLREVRISILTAESSWAIWQHEESLHEWMVIHGKSAIQIRPHDHHPKSWIITMKGICRLFSVKDLEAAAVTEKCVMEVIRT